jgi:transposase-like protein
MKAKQNKKLELKLNSLLDIQKIFPDEKSCRDFLIKQRWNGSQTCIKCGSNKKLYRINDGKLLECSVCKKQFSVRVGTIFEDSALPLQKWFFALYLLTAHKKGISSCQLSRDIQVTQKTAWFMLHRIRHAIKTKHFGKPLSGIVEADETYVGGKMHGGKVGRGSENKTAVFGMIERQGEVRAMPVPNTVKRTLQPIIIKNVAKGSTIMTDEYMSYNGLNRREYIHRKISHGKNQYVRGGVHTQNIENFWSLLKRGIIGIYHHVSKEHLSRYCDEFEYRYNSREKRDAERFVDTLARCEGRLQYKKLIA